MDPSAAAAGVARRRRQGRRHRSAEVLGERGPGFGLAVAMTSIASAPMNSLPKPEINRKFTATTKWERLYRLSTPSCIMSARISISSTTGDAFLALLLLVDVLPS